VDALPELLYNAQAAIAGAHDPALLDQVRVHYLGKKGVLTERLKALGKLPAEERRQAGQAINEAKQTLETALTARKIALEAAALDARLVSEAMDVTLPGRGQRSGGYHPVSRTLARIQTLFTRIGFTVAEGQKSKTISAILRRSTSRCTIQRGRCTTPSISTPTPCCAPTPRPCKSG